MTRKLSQIVLLAALIAAPLFATTIKKMELPELVTTSDAIAQGTVESIDVRWEDKSIYTYTSLRVDEAIKGGPRRAMLIRQPGGTIGNLTLNAPGTPQFTQGSQVIVFLRDRRDGTFDVVGLSQGKYDIQDNVAVTNTAGVSLIDTVTGRLIEGGAVDKKPLATFKNQIRGLIR